jgi:EmrB/QacA subfamily drug resistance transporter
MAPGPAGEASAPAPAPHPYAVLGVVAVGTFMSALGASLINVAVPRIRADFHADMGVASWVPAAYTLAVCALLLPAGRVGDLFGKRRVYAAGFAVFGVGAALCAVAPTLGMLIASRALQGAGAAMLMSTGPALTTAAFPAAQRGHALGMQATATYTGLTVGPSIGGMLVDGPHGWHLAFGVTAPVALAGVLLARFVLQPYKPARAQPFPWTSALLLGPGLAALLVAVTRGQAWGWSSASILLLFASGAALFAAFVRAEARSAAPLVSAALLRQPAMAGGIAGAFLQYASVYTMLFLLPFYLQGPLGMSAAVAGEIMTLQPAVMAVITAASGWLSDRVGTRAPTLAGMAALAVGLSRVATLGPAPSHTDLLAALALVGLGSGLFTSPNNSSIMGTAPRERQGTAAGLLAEARNTGMLTGIAAAGTVFALLGGGRPGEAPAGAFIAAFRGTVLGAAGLAVVGAVVSAVRPVRGQRGV